jgi:hypothetical protein
MPQQPIPPWPPGEKLRDYLERIRRVANLSAFLVTDDWLELSENKNGRSLKFNSDKLFNDLGLTPIQAFITTSNTQDSSNLRWAYGAKIARKATTGHGGWEINTDDVDDQGVQHTYTIYSPVESVNSTLTAGNVFGNGAVADDIIAAAGTFNLAAIPDGTPVYCQKEVISTGTTPAVIQTVEWQIINFPNQVTGQCP